MFFVIRKEKIVSYFLVLCITLCIAWFTSAYGNTAIQTNSGVQKELPIYEVATEENKVSLTINCAWNDSDVDLILETLDKHDVKITFFIVGTWVDKYRRCGKKD